MPYTQAKTAPDPFQVVAAEGVYLELADGRRLIDGIASWWTACHGHRHPHITAAIHDQLQRLPHVMLGGLTHAPVEQLATRLAAVLPGTLDHVFFCDSGSVAVEVAMKIAVQYWINRGNAGRHRFITFRDGYHGDTTGAMSLCDPDEGMHAHFKGFLLEQYPCRIPESAEEFSAFGQFVKAHRREVAAIVIEPLVQAAGGMKMHSPEQLAGIHGIAKQHDLLVIHDEIATGFGRTGRLFASEWAGLVPDIICLGKALSGGVLSLAAVAATREVYDAFFDDRPGTELMHGPTYMGNPLACRAALASLDLFEREPRLEQVAHIEEMGRDLLGEAQRLPGVIEVRACGGFLAVETDRLLDAAATSAQAVAMGLWLRPLRNVVYLAPPFPISEDDLTRLCRGVIALLKGGC